MGKISEEARAGGDIFHRRRRSRRHRPDPVMDLFRLV
jgi:hypothetical protein